MLVGDALTGGVMPTSKPRITITLSDRQHAVLSALSQAQKVSMSSIVVDLVDTTLPVLERLAQVLQNAAAAPQSVLEELKRSAEQAENDVSGVQGSMLEQLDFLVSTSAGMETKPRAGAVPAEESEEGRPPTSNRGVRNMSPKSKTLPISPMKKGEKNGRAQK